MPDVESPVSGLCINRFGEYEIGRVARAAGYDGSWDEGSINSGNGKRGRSKDNGRQICSIWRRRLPPFHSLRKQNCSIRAEAAILSSFVF